VAAASGNLLVKTVTTPASLAQQRAVQVWYCIILYLVMWWCHLWAWEGKAVKSSCKACREQ
jgi:hypothetical protein